MTNEPLAEEVEMAEVDGVKQFKVSRTEVHLAHRAMREELFTALEPILFEPHVLDYRALRPLEKAFAREAGRAYAIGVNSATSGLFLALAACGVETDSEVITVGNSDISTTAAISHCGARPILCDVIETDFTIDPEQVEALVSARTSAILPVDLYGHPANVRRLRAIADRHGLKIVEDAALATGASDFGKPVGAFADVAVFSFGAHKPLGSVGNGGMVVTDDPDIAERVQLLRGYGRLPDDGSAADGRQLVHSAEGYNLPLDPVQAAVVSVKLPHLMRWTAARRRIADRYASLLEGVGVTAPTFRRDSEPTFYCYTVRVPDRDRIYHGLRERGIETTLYYVPPVYQQPVYRNYDFNIDRVPVTTRTSKELLCLPIHPALSDADVTYVVDTLRQLL